MMLKRALFEFRCHWHWIGGITAGFCSLFSAGIPIAATVAFVGYEFKQDMDEGTKSHKDILEWLIALFIGFAAMIPMEVLGIL